MKYIVERSGSYTLTTFVNEVVEVEAASAEEAEDLAQQDDGCDERIRVIKGKNNWFDWDICDEQYVSDALEADVYYERKQLSLAYPNIMVFENIDQSDIHSGRTTVPADIHVE